MKRIIYITFAFFVLTACEDFMEEPVNDFFTVEMALSDPGSTAALVEGVKKSFAAYDYYNAQMFQVLGFNSGVTGRRAGANSSRALAQLIQSANTTWVDKPYSACYSGIASANLIIAAANPESESKSERHALGLSMFARAVHYFNLVRLYGRVPLITTAFDYEAGDSATPRAENIGLIHDQIESDLKQAFELMYDSPSESGSPFDETTPSRWVAKAFLAKLYLNKASKSSQVADWTKARDYALEVIGCGKYSLVDNYADLFNLNTEFTSESIFELAFASAPGAGSAMSNILAPWKHEKSAGKGSWGRIIVLRESYDRMEAACNGVADARMEIGITTRWPQLGGDICVSYPRKAKEVVDEVAANKFSPYPAIAKWIDPNGLDNNTAGNNYIVTRLAEMYLIAAEAENEINGPTLTACGYLNETINRSISTKDNGGIQPVAPADFADKDAFFNRVMDERLLELIGELHSWFDVRRRGIDYFRKICVAHNDRLDLAKTEKLFKSATDEYFPVDDASLTRNLLLPIPSTEINNNPAINPEDQNPGY